MMYSKAHIESFEEDMLILVGACECMFVIIRLFPLIALKQRYTNSGRLVARATKICTVPHNICGSSAWTLLHVSLRRQNFEEAPRTLENLCTTTTRTLNSQY